MIGDQAVEFALGHLQGDLAVGAGRFLHVVAAKLQRGVDELEIAPGGPVAVQLERSGDDLGDQIGVAVGGGGGNQLGNADSG